MWRRPCAGKRFCGSCGAPAGIESAGRTPSPESYIPKHLAEKILTSKSALEGERKQVTVLFADLTGSMELRADRDPEEARKLLDPVLERMMAAVHRYEGTVNLGDGIMALFGASLAHEDHAVRACYAGFRSSTIVTMTTGMSELSELALRAERTVQPSHTWHHDLEGDDVGPKRPRETEALLPAGRGHHPEPLLAEKALHQIPD